MSEQQIKTALEELKFGEILSPEEQSQFNFPKNWEEKRTWAIELFERQPQWNGKALTYSDDGLQIKEYLPSTASVDRKASIQFQRQILQYFTDPKINAQILSRCELDKKCQSIFPFIQQTKKF